MPTTEKGAEPDPAIEIQEGEAQIQVHALHRKGHTEKEE